MAVITYVPFLIINLTTNVIHVAGLSLKEPRWILAHDYNTDAIDHFKSVLSSSKTVP
jgi:hypothetical protein